MWDVFRVSSDKLALCHLELMRKMNDLIRDINKYSDEQVKIHRKVNEGLDYICMSACNLIRNLFQWWHWVLTFLIFFDCVFECFVSYTDERGSDRYPGVSAVSSGAERPSAEDQRRIPQQMCWAGETAQRGSATKRAGKGLLFEHKYNNFHSVSILVYVLLITIFISQFISHDSLNEFTVTKLKVIVLNACYFIFCTDLINKIFYIQVHSFT